MPTLFSSSAVARPGTSAAASASGRIIAIHDNPLKGHMVYQNLHIDFYLEATSRHRLRCSRPL
jgi:hypothetical protein